MADGAAVGPEGGVASSDIPGSDEWPIGVAPGEAPQSDALPAGPTGPPAGEARARPRRRRRRRPPRDGMAGEGNLAQPPAGAETRAEPNTRPADAAPRVGEESAAAPTIERRALPRRRPRWPPRAIRPAETAAGGAGRTDGASEIAGPSGPQLSDPQPGGLRPGGLQPGRGPRVRRPRNRRPGEERPAEGPPRDGASPSRPAPERRSQEPAGQDTARRDRGGPDRGIGDRGTRGRNPPSRGDRPRGSGRNSGREGPARRIEQKLYALEATVDRGFEDVADEAEDSGTRRVHWTIVKRTVADQKSGRPMSATYVLQRDGVDTEFPNLGAARAAANKTIVHPEKLTLSKAEHVAAKKT